MSSIISKFKQHIWLSWKSQCWGDVVPKVMQLVSKNNRVCGKYSSTRHSQQSKKYKSSNCVWYLMSIKYWSYVELRMIWCMVHTTGQPVSHSKDPYFWCHKVCHKVFDTVKTSALWQCQKLCDTICDTRNMDPYYGFSLTVGFCHDSFALKAQALSKQRKTL